MKASDILTDEGKWCQGYTALDDAGWLVGSPSGAAIRWCIQGAAIRAGYTLREEKELGQRIYEKVKSDIVTWQDAPERTFAEVRELLISIGH